MMRQTERNSSDLLERLKRAGCPTLPIAGLPPEPEVKITTVGGLTETTAFDIYPVGTGYIMDVEIVNGFGHPVYLAIEPEFPWGTDRLFRWLADGDRNKHEYWFPGSGIQYPRDLTLNEWLADGGWIGPHGRKAGVLLAWGGPLPKNYGHGELVPIPLVVYDQEERCWRWPIPLSVDRMSCAERRRPAHPRTGLFEPEPQAHLWDLATSRPATDYKQDVATGNIAIRLAQTTAEQE